MNLKIEISTSTAIVLIVWAVAWLFRAALNTSPKTINNTFNGALPIQEQAVEGKPEPFASPSAFKQ